MAGSRVTGSMGFPLDDTPGAGAYADRSAAPPGPVGFDAATPSLRPEVWLTGDFTMLKYLRNRSADELERRIGFHQGRLAAGYRVIVLAPDEVIGADDFDFKASTRWSAGAVRSPGSQGPGRDIEDMLEARGQNVLELKEKTAAFFAQGGGNAPAKVLPNQAHEYWMTYPDANALGPGIRSGIPQFRLRPGVRKRAVIL